MRRTSLSFFCVPAFEKRTGREYVNPTTLVGREVAQISADQRRLSGYGGLEKHAIIRIGRAGAQHRRSYCRTAILRGARDVHGEFPHRSRRR